MQRIAPRHNGKFDDAIWWCRQLEDVIEIWIDPAKPPVTALFELLCEADLHIHTIRNHDRYPLTKPESQHFASYIQAAVDALHSEMERAVVLDAQTWAQTSQGLKEARRWLEKNNPPAENPIKY